jgi:hypothetical protein
MHFLDVFDILADLLGLFQGRDEKKKKRSSKPRQKRTSKAGKQPKINNGIRRSSKERLSKNVSKDY